MEKGQKLSHTFAAVRWQEGTQLSEYFEVEQLVLKTNRRLIIWN